MKTSARTNEQVCSAHVRMQHQHLLNVPTEFNNKKIYHTNQKSKQFFFPTTHFKRNEK